MVELSVPVLAALAVAALVAGFIDAIAGGGGLITLPALLTAGLAPHVALGTNKGQSVFGSFAALARFWRGGLVDRQRAKLTFPAGLVGALAGAALVLVLEAATLKPLVLVLLVAAGAFMAFRRPTAELGQPAEVFRPELKAFVIALIIGTYDGFFGPGTGTFLIIAFVTTLKLTLPQATADAKVVNFASNFGTLVLMAFKGKVVWAIALPMAVGQFIGGILGAHFAIKGGAKVIRVVVLGVVSALVLKLGFDLWR